MADEDDRTQADRLDHLDQVVGVAAQIGVALRIETGAVRGAGADMVEQDDAGHAVEPIGDRSPHALVAAEAVREQKDWTRVTRDGDVVAAQNRHGVVRSAFICDDCQADLSSYFEKTLKNPLLA